MMSSKQVDDSRPPSMINGNYGSTTRAGENEDGETKRNKIETVQMHQGHNVKGIIFITLGAFSFSIMFLLVKIMGPGANTFTLVLYRSLVQIAISLVTLMHHGENPLGPPDCRFWLCVRGFFGSAAVCAWFFGACSGSRTVPLRQKFREHVNVLPIFLCWRMQEFRFCPYQTQ
jgi:drug/metabolite transporter (DMT)-like permease